MGRADRRHVRPPLTATEPRPRVTPAAGACVAVLVLTALAVLAALLASVLLDATGTAAQDPRLRPAATAGS